MNPVLRSLLTRELERRSRTPASVSRALGKNPSWLYRILSGERRITVASLEEVVLELGLGLDEFFAEYLQVVCSPHMVTKSGHAEEPQMILRALRGPRDPDLGWISELSRNRVTPLQPGQSFPIHAKVRRLDDAREFDRHAALVDAEAWLRSFHARSKQRRLSARETSQLCTALGVWSSVQRSLGKQAHGAKVLELAWGLHGTVVSSSSSGDLLERTAMSLHQFGYSDLGLPLMQRAFAIATFEPDEEQTQARRTLGVGILAFHSGESRQALGALTQTLEHPGADSLRIAAATGLLARISEREGELEKARRLLGQLLPRWGELPVYVQHSILGHQARILRAAGDLSAARSAYEQLLEHSYPLLAGIDRASIVLHLAEVLLELGLARELCTLSQHLNGLLVELEDTPAARKIIGGLLLAIRRGEEILLADLREMQRQLLEPSTIS